MADGWKVLVTSIGCAAYPRLDEDERRVRWGMELERHINWYGESDRDGSGWELVQVDDNPQDSGDGIVRFRAVFKRPCNEPCTS